MGAVVGVLGFRHGLIQLIFEGGFSIFSSDFFFKYFLLGVKFVGGFILLVSSFGVINVFLVGLSICLYKWLKCY